MYSKLLPWLLLLGFAVTVNSASAAAAPAAQTAGQIRAKRVVGEVTVTDKATNATQPLVNDALVSQGSIVTTGKGASVVLNFSNGANINLGTDSSLDIQQFTQDPFGTAIHADTITEEPTTSQTRLQLIHGELVGKVAKLKTTEGSSFNITTPVGAAGIRGTTFRIVYRPDGTGKAFFSLTTLEGNVEVTLATGTVTPPIAVTDDKEVVLADVTVDVNPQTGVVTITTAAGTTVVPVDAPTTSTQLVVAAAQQIATAIAALVIPPTSGNGTTGGTTSGTTGTNQDTSSPGPTTTNRTTPGDGK